MRYILFVAVLYCNYSLAQTKIESGEILLKVDPAVTFGGVASQVFNHANYLPLETTKESVFGRIDLLHVTKKYFVIYDSQTDAILLFNRDGKYHCKINKVPGLKKIFKRSFSNFSIDEVNERIVVSFGTKTRKVVIVFAIFDFNGILIEMVKQQKDIQKIGHFSHLSNNEYVFTNSPIVRNQISLSDSSFYYSIFFVNQLNRIQKKELKIDVEHDIIGDDYISGQPFFKSEDSLICFIKPLDYSVYTITSDGVKCAYRFLFPLLNTPPKRFFEDKELNDKRAEYLLKHPAYIYYIDHFYKTGHLLTFNLFSYSLSGQCNLLYSLKTQTTYSFKDIIPDSSTSYLPIISTFNGSVHASEAGYLYTSVSSSQMFRAKDLMIEKGALAPLSLQGYFSKGSKLDNPVIVQLQPKESL